MKKPVRVKTISMSIGFTLPHTAQYGSVKPIFGAEFEVPVGADPDEVRENVVWPWVRFGFMRMLRRSVTAYSKADDDLGAFIKSYEEKNPESPPLTIECTTSTGES